MDNKDAGSEVSVPPVTAQEQTVQQQTTQASQGLAKGLGVGIKTDEQLRSEMSAVQKLINFFRGNQPKPPEPPSGESTT